MPVKSIFFYSYPQDDRYFQLLIARTIYNNFRNYPESKHIVWPIYGARIYSPLKSKYPRTIKYLQSLFQYLIREYQLWSNTKNSLRKLIPADTYKALNIVPFWRWCYSLAITYLQHNKSFSRKENIDRDNFIRSYCIEKVKVGDLITDTYLRFKGEPSCNQKHWFFKDIIWRAHAICRLSLIYLQPTSNIFHFGIYSTYINHGITLRVALSFPRSTAVTYGLVKNNYVIHKNLPNDILPSHFGYHQKYNIRLAKQLPKEVINNAEISLINRCQGHYDTTMKYMNKNRSQIQSKQSISSNLHDKVVLMLHDFFDSPHIYQWLLFPDFWDWAIQSINFCEKNKINIVIKPHPNQLPENQVALKHLKQIFSTSNYVEWIPKEINTFDIFKSKPRAILSAYGSVAAEATYYNLPVLLAGDHPGINFSIGTVPSTRAEYFNYLLNSKSMKAGNKEDAILFTALHHKVTLDPQAPRPIIDQISENEITKIRRESCIITPKSLINCIDAMIREIPLDDNDSFR